MFTWREGYAVVFFFAFRFLFSFKGGLFFGRVLLEIYLYLYYDYYYYFKCEFESLYCIGMDEYIVTCWCGRSRCELRSLIVGASAIIISGAQQPGVLEQGDSKCSEVAVDWVWSVIAWLVWWMDSKIGRGGEWNEQGCDPLSGLGGRGKRVNHLLFFVEEVEVVKEAEVRTT